MAPGPKEGHLLERPLGNPLSLLVWSAGVLRASGLKGKVFLLSENFQRTHSAMCKKPGLGLLAPCVDLNVAKLCMATQLDKDSAQQMMGKVGVGGRGSFVGQAAGREARSGW